MHKQNKKLVFNVLLFSVTPRIDAILSLFIFPLITPFLTEADFGVWGIISSYFAIGSAISTLGLELNLTNSFFVYGSRFRYAWRFLSGLIHISGLLFTILFAALLYIILPEMPNKLLLVIVSSLPIILQNVNAISSRLFILRESALPITKGRAIGAIFSVGVTYLLITTFKLGFWGWAVAYLVNALLFYLVFFKFLYLKEKIYPALRLKMSRVRSNLSVALPLIPFTLAMVLLGSSDRIIMERLNINIDEIGLYSLGYRMANYMFSLVAGIIAALTPRLQIYYRSERYGKFMNLIWISHIIILFTILIGSVWMKEVFYVLVRNKDLHVAAPLASIALFAASFHIWYHAVSMPLLIKEKTRLLPWLIIIPCGVNILLNLLLIPVYGYKIALYTTYLGYMLTPWMALFIPQIRRVTRQLIPSFEKTMLFITIINTLALFVCINLLDSTYLIKFLFTGFCLLICGAFTYKRYLQLKRV